MQIKGFEFTSEFARRHRAEGKAEAVVAVLEGRGVLVSEETREIVLACRDGDQLERWLARAGTVDDLLDEAPRARARRRLADAPRREPTPDGAARRRRRSTPRRSERFDVALAGIAASDALREVDEDHAALCHELIRQSLPAPLLQALDDHMQTEGFEFTSEFARRHRAEGKAEAVVAVLEGRGLLVSEEAREIVLACRDVDQLDRWLARAGSVASVDDLLDEPQAR